MCSPAWAHADGARAARSSPSGTAAMPLIRRLRPADAGRLADHLKRLDGDISRLRFGGTLTDSAIDDYVGGIDWLRSLHFGHVESGIVRGACQLAWRDPLWPASAELAVSVEPNRQDQGHGRSEEHTSELQSLMHIAYSVVCWKKKTMNDIKVLWRDVS